MQALFEAKRMVEVKAREMKSKCKVADHVYWSALATDGFNYLLTRQAIYNSPGYPPGSPPWYIH